MTRYFRFNPLESEQVEKLTLIYTCLENTRSKLMDEFSNIFDEDDLINLEKLIIKVNHTIKEHTLLNSGRKPDLTIFGQDTTVTPFTTKKRRTNVRGKQQQSTTIDEGPGNLIVNNQISLDDIIIDESKKETSTTTS